MKQLAIIKQIQKLAHPNQAYQPTIKQFNKFLQTNNLSVNAESIKLFWQELKEKGLSASTLNNKRETLRQSLKHEIKKQNNYKLLMAIDEFFKNEIKKYKLDTTVNPNELITRDELNKLIDNTPKKLSLIIKTLALTGLRISTLLNLRIASAKVKKGIYYFNVVSKGNKQRTIYLPANLINEIKQTFNGKDYLFVNQKGIKPLDRFYVWKQVNEYSEKILGYGIKIHHLRHYFITNQIKQGNDVKSISHYVGHNSVSFTLSVYCHSNTLSPEEILAKAI